MRKKGRRRRNKGATRRMYVKNHAEEIDMRNDDFNDCMITFLSELDELGRSEYTIEYYRQELAKFMYKMEENDFETSLGDLTRELIKDEYVYIRRVIDDVSTASIASGLRALRAFLNWAVREKIIVKNPMDEVLIPEPRPPKIETFSRDQIRHLLSQPDPKLFHGLRDLTFMIVLLDTGVRVRELCDIKVDDVRFEDHQILIEGKNGEYRLVPIQTQTRRALKRYIAARGSSPVDWLFITVDETQMSRSSVRDRISKYGRMAGIDNVRCSPHTFRHTFAKMSVQNGADVFNLQKILGHKTLDMVRRYVNMFSSDTKRAHKRFSPVENLRLRL